MGEKLDAAALLEELREVFASGKTKAAAWRIEQLNGLEKLVTDNEAEIAQALKDDMNKPAFECYIAEFHGVREAAIQAAKNLKKWMAPEKVSPTLTAFPAKAAIIPEPLGVTLVISAWNFPFTLSLEPVVGAIAAGNVVVIKPSELAPASSAVIAKLLPKYLDSNAVRVVEGGVPETTALLEQPWDKIFYTGSTRVAKIIMAAAAKHLTPVTLELGGKSPCIVDSKVDLAIVARRIAWGKWSNNNGQTCITPDYVLAEESIVPQLISKLKDTLKEFYGEDPSRSTDLARIINDTHYNRVLGLLNDEETLEKVAHGGQSSEKSLYIAPTLILDPPLDAPIMQEEIFGPLLAIITVKDVAEAIKIVNSRPKPLALYLFSNNSKTVEQVLQQTSSGGVTVNDTILHFTQPGLPFGGVGPSGMGAYHGKHSFDVFSHKKSVLYRYYIGDMTARYPPFHDKKKLILKALLTGDVLGLFRAFLGFK